MLSNYWNPSFSYLIMIKKDVCRNISKLISFLFFNHPGTYTDRGENFGDKNTIQTLLITIFQITFLQAFLLKIHSTFEKKIYDAFLEITQHHPTFLTKDMLV